MMDRETSLLLVEDEVLIAISDSRCMMDGECAILFKHVVFWFGGGPSDK